jgi:histone acetyltransferase 1
MELDLAEKEWVCNANEVLEIKLFAAQKTHKFNPQLTYQIFPEEIIYGYKNLRLTLSYCAASLYSYLSIKYDTKNNNPQDVVSLLNKVVKQDTFSYDEFTAKLKEDQKFKPMGEKIHEYTQDGTLYELYKCDFETKNFQKYHDRIKSFLFWFIEGSSTIEEDHRWEIVLLYVILT